MGPIDTVTIKPVGWSDWTLCGSEEYRKEGIGRTYPNRRMVAYSLGYPYHRLIELGRTTNTYQYGVYACNTVLVYETIKPSCCGTLSNCPLGKREVPTTPCRVHLRAHAAELAQRVWVQFMTELGGG